ncbi:MAG: toprim domain-containing protein [Methanoculleus horonobensis]|nr:toprim domain-containing protein [Methanoculleus horonobensis]
MKALMESACRFFERNLTEAHRKFLLERYGFQPWFVERMRIGYAPANRSSLLLHLMDREYQPEAIIGSGLVTRWEQESRSGVSDLFRGRYVFPYLDGERKPGYFAARATPETPAQKDEKPPKYLKNKGTSTGPQEQIFGTASVTPGEPLVVTEGVADALSVLQAGHPCISPVTTSFKRDRVDVAAAFCRLASAVYVVMDSEDSEAGSQGAVRTALALQTHGISRVYIGTIPRPEGVGKVDLNDYLRNGGNLDDLLAAATPAEQHPAIMEERRKEWSAGIARLRSAVVRQRWESQQATKKTKGKTNGVDDIEDLKNRMPSLSAYTGILPGKRGAHPIYGSTHGDNFLISRDGETWTSFHGGNDQGKSGNLFKLVALEQGFLVDERQPLRGEAFKQTIEYCRDRWA